MEPINKITAQTVPILADNIDTDLIIPKQFLTTIHKQGLGKHAFYNWRYNADGSLNLNFLPNKDEYQHAKIIISKDNFGIGSSREHAVWAILDYGFKAVIAGSFGDIFYNNALKNGLLPVVLPTKQRELLYDLEPEVKIEIDLESKIVATPSGDFPFDIDESWRQKLLLGQDEIDVTLKYLKEIKAFENKYLL